MKLRYIPNILTSLRFLLVAPVLMSLLDQHYLLALCLFLLAGLTDGLDGLLARLYGWTSYFGAVADPLADKLLLTTSFIALAWLGHIPSWLVVAVVARDVWIMGGVLAYRYFVGELEFKPIGVSKINTFLQILLVILLLTHLSIYPLPLILLQIVMWLVLVTSLISFLHYTSTWTRLAVQNHNGSEKI